MNLHEYQAKEILRRFDVPAPRGEVAHSVSEARRAAEKLGGDHFAVKAQIHAGGRGKGGGIKIAKSLKEVEAHAKALLGSFLITPQTGAEGKKVRKIYIEEASRIKREFYLSFVLNRALSRPALIVSAEGGMDIEEVAKEKPDAVSRLAIDPLGGILGFHIRQAAGRLALEKKEAKALGQTLRKLYRAFTSCDMSLLEINPLILTREGDLLCLDAKIALDDNALFRHPDLALLRDPEEEDPMEREARKRDLNYIKLDGSIGCMVNGAGLAMATMDMIKAYGAEPANFLDVGGGASREKVADAFRILLSDPKVKAILVNIFGGIMRCDLLAEGVCEAAKETALHVPLIVRLAGTRAEEGRQILERSDLALLAASSLKDAAEKAVAQL